MDDKILRSLTTTQTRFDGRFPYRRGRQKLTGRIRVSPTIVGYINFSHIAHHGIGFVNVGEVVYQIVTDDGCPWSRSANTKVVQVSGSENPGHCGSMGGAGAVGIVAAGIVIVALL